MQPEHPTLRITPPRTSLSGAVTAPPDKAITHRALFFAALNAGTTTIHNASTAADPTTTLHLLETLGYSFERRDGADCSIVIRDGARRAAHAGELLLDCGNSGTTARFATGLLCGERGRFTLTGDASLVRRPMERVAAPLRELGARIETSEGKMPVVIDARYPLAEALAITEAASAQVHGALVFAGLRAPSGVVIRRTRPMRDHTIRMARAFGVDIITIDGGGQPLDEVPPAAIERDVELRVPGDISAAAFFVAAAVITPGAELRIEGVGLNPTRIAMLRTLRRMGASIEWRVGLDAGDEGSEPTGTIEAAYSPNLLGIDLDGGREGVSVSEMMDELPVLALVASQANGRTTVRDAADLRAKESDRIAATVRLLGSIGVAIDEHPDGFSLSGPQRIAGGAVIDHCDDHRLAMVAAVAALIAEAPVDIPDPAVVGVSHPGFFADLERIGAGVETIDTGR